MLRKSLYPVCVYEYIDSWERLNETSLPSNKEFYNNLKNGAITNDDYKHVKRVREDFRIQTLGQYHDLYVQLYTATTRCVWKLPK